MLSIVDSNAKERSHDEVSDRHPKFRAGNHGRLCVCVQDRPDLLPSEEGKDLFSEPFPAIREDFAGVEVGELFLGPKKLFKGVEDRRPGGVSVNFTSHSTSFFS